jgi:redox-sensitive bicupin YhaK (pirin superfamily)
MSNLEQRPAETECGGVGVLDEPELLAPREVPLGGPRAMTVRRTLPHRDRRMVGAWCFVDHYGPHDLSGTVGMDVPPHPHTGLQTVSWLLEGEVEHRDSLGSNQLVRPGQLNLMTAGHGISHSEETPALDHRTTEGLHGVQLWVALPAGARSVAPAFEHHASLPVVQIGGAAVTVVLGSLAGATSPATTYTPLVGADVTMRPGASSALPLEPRFEHAVLAMDGDIEVNGRLVRRGELLYLPPGPDDVELAAPSGEAASRALLIGGEPFAEQIVMWWNFVGTDHDAIAAARAQWQARDVRFGEVDGYGDGRLDAPALPNSRLKARGRTRR